MRVAFFTSEMNSSYGWARYALELADALRGQGIEVVALTQPSRAADDESAVIATRAVLPQLVPRPRGFVGRLAAHTLSARRAVADCDLLHVIAEPYSPLAALVAGGRPLVVTAHGTYVPRTARRRGVGALYRWAYRRSALIAVSEHTARQVRAALPAAAPVVIPNGVHFEHFQVPAPAPDKRGPTILASGRVSRRKGTHLLVAALARVREQVPDAQLVITGGHSDPGYVAEVQAQIAALGLQDAAHITGMIPERELLGWYQHADVFALPALTVSDRFEGFGLVLLEASASGLPTIATTGSGVEEAVVDGETGLLLPQNDVPALADALLRLLRDPDLRARMGEAGRAYARTQDWSAVAERVAAVYRAAVGV
jgi:glycosyltransferase involved in cell wall biosynthesis